MPDESAADAKPTGRHAGLAGGLSASELIARTRAAEGLTQPTRATRSARRAAEPDEDALPEVDGGPAPVTAQPERRPQLAFTADPEGRPDGSRTAEPTGRPRLSVVDLPVQLPEDPPPVRSRAGRNLPAAIGVGVGLAALILLSVFLYRPSFVVVVTVAATIGIYEMVTAIASVEARPPLIPLLVGGIAMDAAAWFRGPDGLVGTLMLTVVAIIVWRLADGAEGYLQDVVTSALVALYVPFLAGFAALLAHPHDGAARIVLFVLAVVCSDTGGYATGVLIGRHPMAPMVSPKKSWEGFGGSLLASGLAGALMMDLCFHRSWWQGALFGAAIAVTATVGDLGESMIKRDLGLKDMGRLLPGHGGLMDRLDSLLPCAPVAYLLLTAILRG
jgi:phosphatidate cytidylyltransferase